MASFLCRTAEQFEPIRLHMGGKASEPSKKIKKYSFPFVQKREHLSVKVINEPLNCMQKKNLYPEKLKISYFYFKGI